MEELPEEVWWYSEDRSDQRSVTMEPEGSQDFMLFYSCVKLLAVRCPSSLWLSRAAATSMHPARQLTGSAS